MKFFDYTEAERKEWRESDVTRAFLARLKEEADECSSEVLQACRLALAGPVAGRHVGAHDAFMEAIEIANEVTK